MVEKEKMESSLQQNFAYLLRTSIETSVILLLDRRNHLELNRNSNDHVLSQVAITQRGPAASTTEAGGGRGPYFPNNIQEVVC